MARAQARGEVRHGRVFCPGCFNLSLPSLPTPPSALAFSARSPPPLMRGHGVPRPLLWSADAYNGTATTLLASAQRTLKANMSPLGLFLLRCLPNGRRSWNGRDDDTMVRALKEVNESVSELPDRIVDNEQPFHEAQGEH